MQINESVVVKKDKKWYIGYVKGYTFHKTGEVKKLADVKNVTNYVTLAKYIKMKNKNYDVKQIVPFILANTGLDTIYVLDKPINPDNKEMENFWWSNINEICEKCEWMCKQSSRVILHNCASFKELDGK